MGYTHYYYRPRRDYSVENWNEFIKACKVLYKNMPKNTDSAGGYHKDSPLALGGCFRYEEAKFTASKVYFNGSNGLLRVKKFETVKDKKGKKKQESYWEDEETKDDKLNDLSHETFCLNRKYINPVGYTNDDKEWKFACTKTARKPYDLMVCAVLILAKFYLVDIKVSSDGDLEDWIPAKEFVGEYFPLAVMNWQVNGLDD